MKWIGLTGSIATGKSTAKKLIEGLGYPVIDADLISHQVTELDAAGYRAVVSHFGNEIINSDKTLNRKKLGSLIFKDPVQRLKLENLLHPLIKDEVQKKKAAYQADGRIICFYDVPLLFEKNLAAQFDSVILVWCEYQQQLTRLVTRNQMSVEDAELRIQSQMPLIDKVKRAQHCLDNSTTIDNLQIQLTYLIKSLV